MTWQFYLGVALGLLSGAFVGFVVGRLLHAQSTASASVEKIEKIDATAEAQRKQIDDEILTRWKAAQEMRAKELGDALDKDLPSVVPDGLVRPPDAR